MSETPKTITVTIEQLVAFADHAQNNIDSYGECNGQTDEELVAEFFGVEVPPKPAPPKSPVHVAHDVAVKHRFGSLEDKAFRDLADSFTDKMALAQLVKR